MITTQEAAKTLGVTPKTLRLWEKEGKIKSYLEQLNEVAKDLK